MATFNPSSRLGYGALKKETTAGTAVTPTTFFEPIAAPMTVEWNKTPIGTVATKIDKVQRFRPSTVPVSGTIEIFLEPKTAGYFFSNFFGNPTTTTLQASTVFLHEFTMQNAPNTYTFEFQEAGQTYAHRYFGVAINKITISQAENIIKMALDVTAQRAFTNARVTVAVSSGTALTIDQTSGLTTDDNVRVLNQSTFATIATQNIATVVSETVLTVDTISQSFSVGDIVVIASQTPSYSLGTEFLWKGKADYLLGADIDNTTSKDIEDFTFDMVRDLETFFAANGVNVVNRMASAIKHKGFSVTGTIKRFYETEEYLDQLRQKEKVAFRFRTKGDAIGTNASAAQATKNFGSGAGFSVTATAAGTFDGDAGNDLNVVFVINSTDDLAAAISGSTITISLASTTASKNTGTLIAAAVNALTGVDSAAIGAGTDQFTTAVTKANLTGGRDALQKEMLQIDVFNANFDAFNVAIEEDSIVSQDMTFQGAYDSDNAASVKVSLRNNVSAY